MQQALPALVAALGAALAGGVALVAGAPSAVVLGAAVLGAAAGASAAAARRAALPRPGAAEPPAMLRAADTSAHERGLIEALPFGLVVVARDGTISLANRGAVEIFGLPATGRLPVAALRAPGLLELVETALRQGKPGSVEFSLSRGGDAHLRAHVRPLAGPGGDVVVAIADETQARRTAELHRDFVANASHELKTPLAAVSGIIETLLGHARDDPAATERFLGMLAAQTRHMTRLVEDLLSLNRIELNERVEPRGRVDIAAVVRDAIEALRPTAEAAGAVLEFDPPPGAAQVRGDRNELDQLFRNLIENAVKYGGQGTRVRIAAERSASSPGMIGVAVSDNGPGIAREHLPRLTERFYRVSVSRSREKGGTGLGLAIVKHVVNRHRGRLEIDSRPGDGSRFTVWLPAAEPAGDDAESRRPGNDGG